MSDVLAVVLAVVTVAILFVGLWFLAEFFEVRRKQIAMIQYFNLDYDEVKQSFSHEKEDAK